MNFLLSLFFLIDGAVELSIQHQVYMFEILFLFQIYKSIAADILSHEINRKKQNYRIIIGNIYNIYIHSN